MKYLSLLLISSFIFIISTSSVSASLLSISKDGKMNLKVLGEQTDAKVDITKVAVANTNSSDKVFFTRNDGGVNMKIVTSSGEENLEVTDFGEDLVEIAERPNTQKMTIGVEGGVYTLTQGDIKVVVNHDISIDPQTARLSLTTPQGIRYISIFPQEATGLLTRSKTLSQVKPDSEIVISEDLNGSLNYEIKGTKELNVLNIITLPVDVTGYVSTSTGDIVSVDQPVWLPVADYLFR